MRAHFAEICAQSKVRVSIWGCRDRKKNPYLWGIPLGDEVSFFLPGNSGQLDWLRWWFAMCFNLLYLRQTEGHMHVLRSHTVGLMDQNLRLSRELRNPWVQRTYHKKTNPS